MKTTKLSEKLRRLGRQKADIRDLCYAHAAKLDMSANTHGTGMSKDMLTYRLARTFYCQKMGRAYDWGAGSDLDMVDRDDSL